MKRRSNNISGALEYGRKAPRRRGALWEVGGRPQAGSLASLASLFLEVASSYHNNNRRAYWNDLSMLDRWRRVASGNEGDRTTTERRLPSRAEPRSLFGRPPPTMHLSRMRKSLQYAHRPLFHAQICCRGCGCCGCRRRLSSSWPGFRLATVGGGNGNVITTTIAYLNTKQRSEGIFE
jgi:hypothetical protein